MRKLRQLVKNFIDPQHAQTFGAPCPGITNLLPRYDGPWRPDLPLAHFTASDDEPWTFRDLYKSLLILGDSDAGKSSGSGRFMARKLLRAGCGVLVFCYKTDEADWWRKLVTSEGRENDARFFSIDQPWRFNFLQEEAQRAGPKFADNVAELLNEILGHEGAKNRDGKDESFAQARQELIKNAVRLCLLADEPVTIRALYEIVDSIPETAAQADKDDWKASSYLYGLLYRGQEKTQGSHDWYRLHQYFLKHMASLVSETRGGVTFFVVSRLSPLAFGGVNELFSTHTNLSPRDLFNGAVVIVDVPIAQYHDAGRFAAQAWSILTMRAIEAREIPPGDYARPVVLWMDEAQHFLSERLARFLSTCRSKCGCAVMLSQTINNFRDAYGSHERYKADLILGLPGTNLFHLLGDPDTREWAARRIDKEPVFTYSFTDSGSRQRPPSTNASERHEFSCPPWKFLQLDSGGKRSNYVVTGVLYQPGRVWTWGREKRRWIEVAFCQI